MPLLGWKVGNYSQGEREAGWRPTHGELQGIARFRFYEGRVEDFKRLSAQCMDIVRARDIGTPQYEIYFNEDQTECIVLERYRDAAPLMEHMSNLGDLAQAILATGGLRRTAR